MMSGAVSIVRLGVDGDETIEGSDLERRLMAGEVIVVRNGLSIGGALDRTREIIFQAIEEVAGSDVSAKAKEFGLEKVHELVDVKTIDAFHTLVTQRLRREYLPITERIVRELFRSDKFWINYNAVMRFYVPNSVMSKDYAKLKHKGGKLIQHGPHHDIWQNVALNAINIWMAVERVTVENGMIVFSDHFGKILPRGGEHVRKDQYLGHPIKTVCEPGDIVLFHSQHLHGGILNRSDRTRVVVTTRFTLSPPRHPRMGAGARYTTASAVRSGSLWREKLAVLREGLRPANLLRRIENNRLVRPYLGRPGDEGRRLRALDPFLKKHWFQETQDRSGEQFADPNIRIVDDKTIAVRVNGKEHVVSRTCPHQGADLARGYVCNDLLHCPWHDQPFDPVSGQAVGKCAGLKALRSVGPD